MKDFQNKSGRLNKRDDKADFRLADNDDFFGFSPEDNKFMVAVEYILIALLLVAVLYAFVWVYFTVTPNI